MAGEQSDRYALCTGEPVYAREPAGQEVEGWIYHPLSAEAHPHVGEAGLFGKSSDAEAGGHGSATHPP